MRKIRKLDFHAHGSDFTPVLHIVAGRNGAIGKRKSAHGGLYTQNDREKNSPCTHLKGALRLIFSKIELCRTFQLRELG